MPVTDLQREAWDLQTQAAEWQSLYSRAQKELERLKAEIAIGGCDRLVLRNAQLVEENMLLKRRIENLLR